MPGRLRCMLFACLIAAGIAHAEVTLDDLLGAAEQGNNALVMDSVRRGMDVDSCDRAGVSLLMRAAREGNLELVDFLLRNRARVQAQTSWGDTALTLAAYNGRTAVVQRLIEAGAPVNQPGWSAILYAAMQGHDETVRQLLKQRADPNARAPSRMTPLMVAAKGGHLAVVRTLLEAGAEINAENDRGDTALKWALAAQNTDIADVLRAAGAR